MVQPGSELSSPDSSPAPGRCFGSWHPPPHPSGPRSPSFPAQEVENANSDPLHGLRVHCWVLVLSGKREVPESFFIDPFTARSYSTQDDHFLGIESLWNHKNYWVNMQDCWNCCKVPGWGLGQLSLEDKGVVTCGESWLPGHEDFRLSPELSPHSPLLFPEITILIMILVSLWIYVAL